MAISFSQRQYWRFLYKVPLSTFYTLAPESAVCVCHPLYLRVPPLTSVTKSFECRGAIPLPSGGWPTKRPLGGAANVPAELLYKLSLHSFFVCFHGGSCYFP